MIKIKSGCTGRDTGAHLRSEAPNTSQNEPRKEQETVSTEHATSATLKVGVVGIGWAGQQHLEAYSKIDGVEIVAAAGMEEELLAAMKEQYSIPHAFPRWEDMIELEGLDAISVAVPTFLHAPIAIAALE